MAKSTCLIALFVAVVVCTEAIRIDTARESTRTGKHFPSYKVDDPRCRNRSNGLYPDPKDCTKYLKCINGEGRDMKCPSNFKFDSYRHCVPPTTNPNCGKDTFNGPLDVEEKCPEPFGIFPVKSDCHKFLVCNAGKQTIKDCPEGHVFGKYNKACVYGDKCPKQSSEESVCETASQRLPDEKNCRAYIQCVNFQQLRKECPPGTAFDPKEHRCTKEQLEECKNNSVLVVGQHDDE